MAIHQSPKVPVSNDALMRRLQSNGGRITMPSPYQPAKASPLNYFGGGFKTGRDLMLKTKSGNILS
jgi:hypothetical protein